MRTGCLCITRRQNYRNNYPIQATNTLSSIINNLRTHISFTQIYFRPFANTHNQQTSFQYLTWMRIDIPYLAEKNI